MSLAEIGSIADLLERLDRANQRRATYYPGFDGGRQPVHTVYGGAHRFRRETARRLGDLALAALERFAPDALTLGGALEAETLPEQYDRIEAKLRREPVEDFRLDFEDGYGRRADEEEDRDARSAAQAVAAGMETGDLPPFIGIRVKPLSSDLAARSLGTLHIFLNTLLDATRGGLPGNFVVTLPKVSDVEHVAVFSEALSRFESGAGLPEGTLRMEIMIETTTSIVEDGGSINVRRLVEAGDGRVKAAHFGAYDYTAACDITAAHQSMTHPACDFARHVMQVALSGTGVWLSDGSTNVLPVPIHRGDSLTIEEESENRAKVHAAWRLHFYQVKHSLVHGFYQGWDLHPAQLVTRYAAVFDFFASALEAASQRLSNLVAEASQATLLGEVFDDAATGQGLLNFFRRAVNSGAITAEEASERSTLTLEELRTGSFVKMLESRRTGAGD